MVEWILDGDDPKAAVLRIWRAEMPAEGPERELQELACSRSRLPKSVRSGPSTCAGRVRTRMRVAWRAKHRCCHAGGRIARVFLGSDGCREFEPISNARSGGLEIDQASVDEQLGACRVGGVDSQV